MSLEQTLLNVSTPAEQTGPEQTPDILAHIEARDASFFLDIPYEDLLNYTARCDTESNMRFRNFGEEQTPFESRLTIRRPSQGRRNILSLIQLRTSLREAPYLIDDSFSFI